MVSEEAKYLEFVFELLKEKEKYMYEDCFVPKNYDTMHQLCGFLFWWERNETIVNRCSA